MNFLVNNCVKKLAVVMKSRGNTLTDNLLFTEAVRVLVQTAISGDRKNGSYQSNFTFIVNKKNNDLLEEVALFQSVDGAISSKNTIVNLQSSSVICIEVRDSVFDKYDAIELFSLIMNLVSQTIITTTSSCRTITMLNQIFETGMNKRTTLFNARLSLVLLHNYVTSHPYHAFIEEDSPLTAHEFMRNFDLSESYNEVLINKLNRTTVRVNKVIETVYDEDVYMAKALSRNIFEDENDFRGYIDTMITMFPYIGFREIVLSQVKNFTVLSNTDNHRLLEDLLIPMISSVDVQNEAFFGLGNTDYSYKKYRYKIDDVLIMMQNMEFNDEKQYILNRIRKLEIEMDIQATTRDNVINTLKAKDTNQDKILQVKNKYHGLDLLRAELNTIREKLVNTKPTPKKIGLYVEYPPGWEG